MSDMYGIRHESSSSLVTAVAFSIPFYILASPFPLVGNFSLADAWLLMCAVAIISLPGWRAAAGSVVTGGYATIGLLCTAALMLDAVLSRQPGFDLKYSLQFAFIVWVLIPVIGTGVARMDAPLKFLAAVGIGYLAVYAVGLVLFFVTGNSMLIYRSGPGRLYATFTELPVQQLLFAVALAWAITKPALRRYGLLLFALCVIPVLLNVSRTGLVMIALLVLIAVVFDGVHHRTTRPFVIVLTMLLAASVLVPRLSTSTSGVYFRLLSLSAFAEDEVRRASIRASVNAITSQPWILAFGSGWATSGDEFVTHNLVLQVTQEMGLLFLVPFLALLGLPVVRIARASNGAPDERLFVILVSVAFLLYLMLNALTVQRTYWLPLAVAFGVSARFARNGFRESPDAS